ncbi:MAG: hypothetical protein ACK4TB_00735 [Gemmobacter sp.]
MCVARSVLAAALVACTAAAHAGDVPVLVGPVYSTTGLPAVLEGVAVRGLDTVHKGGAVSTGQGRATGAVIAADLGPVERAALAARIEAELARRLR